MKSNYIKMMTNIIIVQVAVIFLLISLINNSKTESKVTTENMDFDFTNEIRNIDLNMTRNDIYTLEGKEGSIKYDGDWEIIYYEEAKVDGYTGTLLYLFYNEKLTYVRFIFNNVLDYTAYMEDFREKYSEGIKEIEHYWEWDGHTGDKEIIFNTDDIDYIIEKGDSNGRYWQFNKRKK